MKTKLTINPVTAQLDLVTSSLDASTELTGTLPIANGGTGQTTQTAAFNALSPMTTAGDLIYGGASGTGTRLPVGTNGYYLSVVAGNPDWINAAPGSLESYSGYLDGSGGGWGTGSTTYADPTVATTSSTLTTIANNSLGTVIAEATKLPAITITVNTSGTFKITATLSAENSNDGAATYARLVDGSNNIIAAGSGVVVRTGGGWGSITLDGLVDLVAATPMDIKIQLAASGGTSGYAHQSTLTPINWTIISLS